jgi:hypothetical protein
VVAETDAGDGITSAEGRLVSMQLAYLRTDLSEVKATMGSMATSLASLVRIEEQQSTMRQGLDRAFLAIQKGDDRDGMIRVEIDKLDNDIGRRLTAIENELPNYRGLRRWVIGGILAGIAMMAVALFSQFVIDPMKRGWNTQPQVQKPAVYSVPVWRHRDVR